MIYWVRINQINQDCSQNFNLHLKYAEQIYKYNLIDLYAWLGIQSIWMYNYFYLTTRDSLTDWEIEEMKA